MIRHTVVFSLRHPAGSTAESAFLSDAREALTSIPGVEDFAIARQVGQKSALSFQFSMSFTDAASYAAYNVHPTHVAFVDERWLVDVSEFQEYDFEIYESAD